MNIGLLILMIVGGGISVVTTLYLIISMFGMIGYKIYRAIRFGASLYD